MGCGSSKTSASAAATQTEPTLLTAPAEDTSKRPSPRDASRAAWASPSAASGGDAGGDLERGWSRFVDAAEISPSASGKGLSPHGAREAAREAALASPSAASAGDVGRDLERGWTGFRDALEEVSPSASAGGASMGFDDREGGGEEPLLDGKGTEPRVGDEEAPSGCRRWATALSLVLLVFAIVLLAMAFFWPTATTTPATTGTTTIAHIAPGRKEMDVSTPAPAAAPNTTTTLTSTLTTTTTPHGTCVFWGDPHVITFDESNPSFYGEGEFWIIKSDTVHIQGRFLGTQYTDGLAATNKIVVGGPFLKGHKIEVGPLQGGHAIVDGERVLPTLHSNYSIEDLFELTYDAQGTLIDEKQASFGKHIVHMDLPLGVRVTVDRWINYIDLKIEMQSQAGLDGACGNFNRDSSDDTTQAIIERVGASVPKDELMFHSHAAVNFTVEMKDMLQDDCPKDRLLHARSECESQLSQPSSEEMDSCMFNVCFGGNDHALRVAQTFDPQPNRTKNASAQATGALRDGDNAAELASSTAAPTMAASTTTATAQARAAPLEGSKATDLASPTAAPPTTASTTTATAQARAALREGSKVTELARPTAAPTTTASTTTASAQATAAMHERGKATELAWPTVAPTTAV